MLRALTVSRGVFDWLRPGLFSLLYALPLLALTPDATMSAGNNDDSRLHVSGEGRFRLRDISSAAELPIGAYGEELREGRSFNYRMLLELDMDVAAGITAGALLRLSDEGDVVFATGPERLAEERGSARLRYRSKELQAELGYYRIHLTPLLLMRWDLRDNPEGGGQTGCACGGGGGAITAESLEEIAPDLLFEGMKVNATLGSRFEFTGFAARPTKAVEEVSYRRMSYGGLLRLISYHRPSMSVRSLGVALLLHEDETASIDTGPPFAPTRNRVIGANLDFPVGRLLVLRAEGVITRTDVDLRIHHDEIQEGDGILAELELKAPTRLSTRAAYIRMSPDYRSLFNAVTYTANREGFRLASRWEVKPKEISFWVFYKRLREIDETTPGSREIFTTFSAGGEGVIRKVNTIRLNLVRQDDSEGDHYYVAAELARLLSRRTEVTLRYEYLDFRGGPIDPRLDGATHTTSLLASVEF